MGNTLHSVEPLGEPFRSIDEQVFVIPRHASNEIRNASFKINFMLDGDCLHQVDAAPPVRFRTGDVMIIPRVCKHRYWLAAPGGRRRVHALRLQLGIPPFPNDHVLQQAQGDEETDFAAFLRFHLQEVHHVPHGQDAVIQPLLTELRREAELRRIGYRFRVTALCGAVMTHLVRLITEETTTTAAPASKGKAYLVLQAREFLVKNLASEMHLDQVARHLRVSAEHLARVFKQETGQTVFSCLRDLRLERAKTFLLGSDETVSEIARLTGFSSVALFSRTFKRCTGTGPLAYRQESWDRAAENR